VKVVYPGFWHGFEWKIVVITYAVLIFITLLMHVVGIIRSKKENVKQSSKSKDELVYMNPKTEDE